MTKLSLLKGYWQNAVAGDIMTKAWKLVRVRKCSLSNGLKKAWKEIKDFINKLSNSYAEFKFKLKIEQKTIFLSYTSAPDLDEVVEKSLELIAKQKGKVFIYNISKRFYSRYDSLLKNFKDKGTLTFAKDIFIIKCRSYHQNSVQI